MDAKNVDLIMSNLKTTGEELIFLGQLLINLGVDVSEDWSDFAWYHVETNQSVMVETQEYTEELSGRLLRLIRKMDRLTREMERHCNHLMEGTAIRRPYPDERLLAVG